MLEDGRHVCDMQRYNVQGLHVWCLTGHFVMFVSAGVARLSVLSISNGTGGFDVHDAALVGAACDRKQRHVLSADL